MIFLNISGTGVPTGKTSGPAVADAAADLGAIGFAAALDDFLAQDVLPDLPVPGADPVKAPLQIAPAAVETPAVPATDSAEPTNPEHLIPGQSASQTNEGKLPDDQDSPAAELIGGELAGNLTIDPIVLPPPPDLATADPVSKAPKETPDVPFGLATVTEPPKMAPRPHPSHQAADPSPRSFGQELPLADAPSIPKTAPKPPSFVEPDIPAKPVPAAVREASGDEKVIPLQPGDADGSPGPSITAARQKHPEPRSAASTASQGASPAPLPNAASAPANALSARSVPEPNSKGFPPAKSEQVPVSPDSADAVAAGQKPASPAPAATRQTDLIQAPRPTGLPSARAEARATAPQGQQRIEVDSVQRTAPQTADPAPTARRLRPAFPPAAVLQRSDQPPQSADGGKPALPLSDDLAVSPPDPLVRQPEKASGPVTDAPPVVPGNRSIDLRWPMRSLGDLDRIYVAPSKAFVRSEHSAAHSITPRLADPMPPPDRQPLVNAPLPFDAAVRVDTQSADALPQAQETLLAEPLTSPKSTDKVWAKLLAPVPAIAEPGKTERAPSAPVEVPVPAKPPVALLPMNGPQMRAVPVATATVKHPAPAEISGQHLTGRNRLSDAWPQTPPAAPKGRIRPNLQNDSPAVPAPRDLPVPAERRIESDRPLGNSPESRHQPQQTIPPNPWAAKPAETRPEVFGPSMPLPKDLASYSAPEPTTPEPALAEVPVRGAQPDRMKTDDNFTVAPPLPGSSKPAWQMAEPTADRHRPAPSFSSVATDEMLNELAVLFVPTASPSRPVQPDRPRRWGPQPVERAPIAKAVPPLATASVAAMPRHDAPPVKALQGAPQRPRDHLAPPPTPDAVWSNSGPGKFLPEAGSPLLSESTAANLPQHSHALPRHLPATLAKAASNAGREDRVELLLDPVELGRVRFELTSVDDRVQVNVSVERPETLDLLRRHVETLRAEFRDAGLDASTLSFSHWGKGGDAAPDTPFAPLDLASDLPDDALATPAPQTAINMSRHGLDLRL